MTNYSADNILWRDVVPLVVVEAENAPCRIDYSPTYSTLMSYFRAIEAANEKSERALCLTEDIISLCASYYSVWSYRREILSHMGITDARISAELQFIDNFARTIPKNYQLWQHRLWINSLAPDPQREICFINQLLAIDPKNYHAWLYRSHIIDKYSYVENELDDLNSYLEKDTRNNSAWNHRFHLMQKMSLPENEEIEFIKRHISKNISNEAVWSYFWGYVKERKHMLPEIYHYSSDLIRIHEETTCMYAMEFVVNCLLSMFTNTNNASYLTIAESYINTLEVLDIRRTSFWEAKKKLMIIK